MCCVVVTCLAVVASGGEGAKSDGVAGPADPPVALTFSDQSQRAAQGDRSAVSFHLQDSLPPAFPPAATYPDAVSYAGGRPGKPLFDRPGDIDRSDCPPERYRAADCQRAGHPHEVAWWAKCASSDRYSAWYVGGGTAWFLPCATRCKSADEGTWGMDYDGVFHPRSVWLKWSGHRRQAGLGAYATERSGRILPQVCEGLGE